MKLALRLLGGLLILAGARAQATSHTTEKPSVWFTYNGDIVAKALAKSANHVDRPAAGLPTDTIGAEAYLQKQCLQKNSQSIHRDIAVTEISHLKRILIRCGNEVTGGVEFVQFETILNSDQELIQLNILKTSETSNVKSGSAPGTAKQGLKIQVALATFESDIAGRPVYTEAKNHLHNSLAGHLAFGTGSILTYLGFDATSSNTVWSKRITEVTQVLVGELFFAANNRFEDGVKRPSKFEAPMGGVPSAKERNQWLPLRITYLF